MQPVDPVDRKIFLVKSGKPHNQAIGHLAESHCLSHSANYLLEQAVRGAHDPDTLAILKAIRPHRDTDPESPTHACFHFYAEDERVVDSNASFFICTPLAGWWLGFRHEMAPGVLQEVKDLFADVAPWFRKMAQGPSLFYPNKCISDAAMLLDAGHVMGDPGVTEEGRAFCRKYLGYWRRRGTGWGEDHSPVYIHVLLDMTLLIMALEKSGDLFEEARALTESLVAWVSFQGGFDGVPTIRGYNFEGVLKPEPKAVALLQGLPVENPPAFLSVLKRITHYQARVPTLTPERQGRWRTFDHHHSTTWISPTMRLGTLSHYPLMPNSYMHDDWGLGWQSKPASFITGQEDYGTFQWLTEDDEGVLRQHEATHYHDWQSRPLFKRLSFHPEVIFASHQEKGAAILFREIHRLHSPVTRIVDRIRLAHGKAEILVGGVAWDRKPGTFPTQWLLLNYPDACWAVRPLSCRVPDRPREDPNPQRRDRGRVLELPIQLEDTGRGTMISLVLHQGAGDTLTQNLLFSGWCVVALKRPADLEGLRVSETFTDDGEIPRPHGELIRAVQLKSPFGSLGLTRDMLTGEETRHLDGEIFRGPG